MPRSSRLVPPVFVAVGCVLAFISFIELVDHRPVPPAWGLLFTALLLYMIGAISEYLWAPLSSRLLLWACAGGLLAAGYSWFRYTPSLYPDVIGEAGLLVGSTMAFSWMGWAMVRAIEWCLTHLSPERNAGLA